MAFTIEIATPGNQPVVFPPMKEMPLRGRWSFRALLGRSAHPSLMAIQGVSPEIPGIYLTLDVKARTASRFDPLAETEAGQKIWSEIEPILRVNKANYGVMKPWDRVTREKLTDDQVKLWLHWMRWLVDNNAAVLAKGSDDLPTIEQIAAMPGRRDNNPSGHKTPIPGGHWVDVVPPPGQKNQQQQPAGR